jgi:hypothetical protein
MSLEETLSKLESNTLFLGILFFIYIIAGDTILEKPKRLARYLKNTGGLRQLVIFSAAFLISQNFKHSLMIVLGYALLFDGLLDCDSSISILPADCIKFVKNDKKERNAGEIMPK